MKTILATIAVLSLLTAGTMAFAHGPGSWGSGQMMGPGYGGQMMGPGYGRQMMGAGGSGPEMKVDQEFLDKTVDLRKSLHGKMFEYREAVRNPDTTNKELTKIEKEIFELRTQIRDKAPNLAAGGYGPCWER